MDSRQPQIVRIKSVEQRMTVAGILVDNGYTVRTVKIRSKTSRSVAYGLEYFREDAQRLETKPERTEGSC